MYDLDARAGGLHLRFARVQGRVERDQQVHRRARDLPAARYAERAAYRVLQSVHRAECPVQRRTERRLGVELLLHALEVDSHRRERIAHLVRERRGELAHRCERLAPRERVERATKALGHGVERLGQSPELLALRHGDRTPHFAARHTVGGEREVTECAR